MCMVIWITFNDRYERFSLVRQINLKTLKDLTLIISFVTRIAQMIKFSQNHIPKILDELDQVYNKK